MKTTLFTAEATNHMAFRFMPIVVLAKTPEDRTRLNTVLYNAAETLRFLCLTLYPFMPAAAGEVKRQLGLLLNFSKPLLAHDISWGGLLPGTEIAKGAPYQLLYSGTLRDLSSQIQHRIDAWPGIVLPCPLSDAIPLAIKR